MAALQICLGARASVTHRGDKLGGLVRRNPAGGHTATAKVRVTLLNGGTDAYKPDDYGCRITVEVRCKIADRGRGVRWCG